MVENVPLGNNLYKVLYGPLDHVYFISLQSKPSKSLVLYDDNYHQIYKIDVSSITGFQRRTIQKDYSGPNPRGVEKLGLVKYIFEIFFGTNNPLTFTFLVYEDCDAFCKNIELTFGVQVYNYGSLNLAALKERKEDIKRESFQNDDGILFVAKRNTPRDFFKVTEIDSEDHSEPPAAFSSKYPVIIEGTMEEGTFLSYRNIRTATLSPFTVYKVEWYLSKSKGSDGEFIEQPFSTDETFYLKEFMIGHYVMVKVYKAIKTYNTRTFVFSTSTKGPVVLSNYLAHNVLVNSVKDTVTHNVLMTVLNLRTLCKLNPPADHTESAIVELVKRCIQTRWSGNVQVKDDTPKRVERNLGSVQTTDPSGTSSKHSASTVQYSEGKNRNVQFTMSQVRELQNRIKNDGDSSTMDTGLADSKNNSTENEAAHIGNKDGEITKADDTTKDEETSGKNNPVTIRLKKVPSKEADIPTKVESVDQGRKAHIYDPMNIEPGIEESIDKNLDTDLQPVAAHDPIPEANTPVVNEKQVEPTRGKISGFLQSSKEKIRKIRQKNINAKEAENAEKPQCEGEESQKPAEKPGLFSRLKEKIKNKGELKGKIKGKVDRYVTKVAEVGKRVKERKTEASNNAKQIHNAEEMSSKVANPQDELSSSKEILKKGRDLPMKVDRPKNYDAELLSIELQICFKELVLMFEEIKFTIPWERINVDKFDNLSTNQDPTMQQQLDTTLIVILKRGPEDTDTEGAKLYLVSQSTFQRNVIYHSMLFNKHRGSHYSMDKCERELQQGFYAGIKKAYTKSCRSIHEAL